MSEHTTELPLDEALQLLLSAPAQVRRSPRYHRAVEVIWAYLNGHGLRYLNRKFQNLPASDRDEMPLKSLESIYNTRATFEAQGERGAKVWLRRNLWNRATDRYRKLGREREMLSSETVNIDGQEFSRIDREEATLHAHAVTADVAHNNARERLEAVQKSYAIAAEAYLESLSSARKDRQARARKYVEVHRALLMDELELSDWYDEATSSEGTEREQKRARNTLQAQVSRFRKALKAFVMNDENDLSPEVCRTVHWTLEKL